VDGASLDVERVVVAVGQLDAFSRFFSRILASVRISADQSFFSSSESSASSSDSYLHYCPSSGVLVRGTK